MLDEECLTVPLPDEISKLQAEIESLKIAVKEADARAQAAEYLESEAINMPCLECREKDEEIERLREALEFYAMPENWKARERVMLAPIWSLVEEDHGKKAREVLEGGK